MSRKDWLTLLISLAALLISGATFTLNRIDAHRAAETKQIKASYNAYQLGKRLATSFILVVQTREGDAKAVEEAKAEGLNFARQAQAYAKSLDVNIDIEELISRHKGEASLIGEGLAEAVQSRLRVEHGARITGRFALGYWLMWLHMQAQAVGEVHPDYAPTFAKDYPIVVKVINEELANLGIARRLPPSMPPGVTRADTLELTHLIEAELDATVR